ncbi:uncharacterized protein C1orf21-like isoform X2 [Mustelus asterias]
MGCASAKHVSTVQNEEEAQKGKNFQNGDVFGEEFRIRTVEEVKYMKNVNREESDWSEKGHAGHEDEQKVAARNQENLKTTLQEGRDYSRIWSGVQFWTPLLMKDILGAGMSGGHVCQNDT